MAKLPPMSRHADAIRTALAENREADAISYAIERLRAGEHHQLFLNVVADLLTPKPTGKRGRPAPRQPSFWHPVGEKFERLREQGITHEQALRDVASEFGMSEKTVERRVLYYREAKAEYDAHVSEMLADDSI